MPIEYFIIVFENGETLEVYSGYLPYTRAQEQAAARMTTIKHILYGRNNSIGEFFPLNAWNKDGIEDSGLLLNEMLERGVNSQSQYTVAVSIYAVKKIMREMKNDQVS